MSGITKKEIAKSVKSLIVMLQSLRDEQVTITLRNDSIVKGTIINVDAAMNIELKDTIIEPDLFYVTDRSPPPSTIKKIPKQSSPNRSTMSNNTYRNQPSSANITNFNKDQDTDSTLVVSSHEMKSELLKVNSEKEDNIESTKIFSTEDVPICVDQEEYFSSQESQETEQEDRFYSEQDEFDQSESNDDSSIDQTVNQYINYHLVKGSRIRFIELPNNIDLLTSTRSEIERLRNRRKQWTKRDIIPQANTSSF